MSILSKKPLIIAGPCSAESFEQLRDTIKLLINNVDIIRAGIWKPRTRPDSFEGVGYKGLKWIKELKKEYNFKFATEVASAEHVELALDYGVDCIWIGARSSANPFTVQNIADALKGIKIPVMIKNPVNPDLDLWIGAFERISKAGIEEIGFIHRGFSTYKTTEYRNDPIWNIAIDIKALYPNIPLICDPSHMGGHKNYIFEISQKALDLDYDGLMIEVHINPEKALSDAKQQITPEEFFNLIKNLTFRKQGINTNNIIDQAKEIIRKIDDVDHEIVNLIEKRMELVEKSAILRLENNIPILQFDRWADIEKTRPSWLKNRKIDPNIIKNIFKAITSEAIKMQLELKKNYKEKEE